MEYVKRYNDILDEIGTEVMLICDSETISKEERQNYDDFLRRYLALVHQEFALKNLGMINDDIWHIWLTYLKTQVKSHHFQDAWNTRRRHHNADPNFLQFIDDLITQANTSNER